MKRWAKKIEKGQILVILTVGVAVLLAFTAVAVDVGQYYSDRRYDQNAADNAALSGAGAAGNILKDVSETAFDCSTNGLPAIAAAYAAAEATATTYGFSITGDRNLDDDWQGVVVTCRNDPYNDLKVQVRITSYVKTFFAHMFFSPELRNTVEAIAGMRPENGLGGGNAIVALSENCEGGEGIALGGSIPPDVPKVTINGSGMHSNSCMKCNGNLSVDADGPLTYYSDKWADTCLSNLTPGTVMQQTDVQVPRYSLTVNCGDPADYPFQNDPRVKNTDDTILEPGNFKSISSTGGKLTLKPGLYCVQGAINISGEVVVYEDPVNDPNNDDGVTIYSMNGKVSIDGTANVNLRAPKSANITMDPTLMSTNDPDRPSIAGVLLYSDINPGQSFTINGGSNTIYTGMVYYPYGGIKINGNGTNIDWTAQIIGNQIDITGDSIVNITYSGDYGHPGTASIGLQK